MNSMAVISHLLKLTILFLFAVGSLVISVEAKTTNVKYCNTRANYVVKVDGVKISPDPVVAGELATFNISASTAQAISGGKLVAAVSYFGIKVYEDTRDICEEATCPVSVGKFMISHTQILPAITPRGSYKIKTTMEDEKNQQLTCISFSFRVGSSIFSI